MVPKYPRIFRNRFRFILVPKYSTTPGPLNVHYRYTRDAQQAIRMSANEEKQRHDHISQGPLKRCQKSILSNSMSRFYRSLLVSVAGKRKTLTAGLRRERRMRKFELREF